MPAEQGSENRAGASGNRDHGNANGCVRCRIACTHVSAADRICLAAQIGPMCRPCIGPVVSVVQNGVKREILDSIAPGSRDFSVVSGQRTGKRWKRCAPGTGSGSTDCPVFSHQDNYRVACRGWLLLPRRLSACPSRSQRRNRASIQDARPAISASVPT